MSLLGKYTQLHAISLLMTEQAVFKSISQSNLSCIKSSDLDGEDEIEEVCELLYDIAKSSENGISADELAVEYQRQFVESGIAKPLPLAWLEYVRLADEFAVTERNGAVIVGIVTKVNFEQVRYFINSYGNFAVFRRRINLLHMMKMRRHLRQLRI